MSFDVGGGGIAAAIQQSLAQTPGTAHPTALAQQFEDGLRRASEASAVSAKQADEAHRKAAEIGDRERKLVHEIPEIRVQPAPLPNAMDEKIVDYLESFHDRTKTFSALMDGVTSDLKSATSAPGGAGTSGAAAAPGSGSSDLQVALEMLERSFKFAIETTLVSKASTESTRVFNNLLKGQ